jgi:hypothetical protein
MNNFVLQVSSSQQINVFPEFSFKESDKKIESVSRARSSRQYVYKFSQYKVFDFDVMYVNSSFKATVNSWWGANAILQFYQVNSGVVVSDVTTVRITNTSKPIDGYILPYNNLFQGSIKLESVV